MGCTFMLRGWEEGTEVFLGVMRNVQECSVVFQKAPFSENSNDLNKSQCLVSHKCKPHYVIFNSHSGHTFKK